MSGGYDLSSPDRFAVGAIGEPGQRLFLLQCRQGPVLLTLKIEKQQVAALAEYLGRIVRDQKRPGHLPEDLALEEPTEPAWAVGTVGVSYDQGDDRVAIVIEAALGFLGVGVPPPTATWGNMLADSITGLVPQWWLVLFPGLAIMIAVLGFNLLGDGLRDALDPQRR